VEIDVGGEDGLRHRVVHARLQGFVLGAMTKPDVVKVDVCGEGAQQRKNVDHLRGLRRELGLVEIGRERGRRREVERERDVLADVEAGVIEMMQIDVRAERIARSAGRLRGGQGGVDIGADLGADKSRMLEVGVVAAGVERGGDVEKRLLNFKGDGGSALFDLCGTRAQRRVGGVLRMRSRDA
jgi:hypothetical protein